jgi:hypothetical protein
MADDTYDRAGHSQLAYMFSEQLGFEILYDYRYALDRHRAM